MINLDISIKISIGFVLYNSKISATFSSKKKDTSYEIIRANRIKPKIERTEIRDIIICSGHSFYRFILDRIGFNFLCAFRDAASELSTLQKCPRSAINQLVALATDETAFGKPSNWNAIQV